MKVKIGNNIFNVKVASTSKEVQEGMMNKNFDKTFNGMLFFMNSLYQSFWMRGCLISLDIIMIDEGKISKIHHNCEPCHTKFCQSYRGKGNLVLELEGGSCETLGIGEDDEVKIIF